MLKNLLGVFQKGTSTRFEKKISYRFKDKSLLKSSLTHKSLQSKSIGNYERLEFLGDAVIELVVSKWLYENYPDADEGVLTKKRASLVNKSFLAKMGSNLDLIDFIHVENGVNLSNPKVAMNICGDLYESVIGAIFLDGGISQARRIINNTLLAHASYAREDDNYKGILIEACHEKDLPNPNFSTISTHGPDHSRLFIIQVSIGKKKRFIGKGRSKKIAEQNAAKAAIIKLKLHDVGINISN